MWQKLEGKPNSVITGRISPTLINMWITDDVDDFAAGIMCIICLHAVLVFN